MNALRSPYDHLENFLVMFISPVNRPSRQTSVEELQRAVEGIMINNGTLVEHVMLMMKIRQNGTIIRMESSHPFLPRVIRYQASATSDHRQLMSSVDDAEGESYIESDGPRLQRMINDLMHAIEAAGDETEGPGVIFDMANYE